MTKFQEAEKLIAEVLANPQSVVRRGIKEKNYNSPNLVLYRKDLVLYALGILEELILVDENDKEIERYYGYGLRKLIQSHRPHEGYFLAKRCFKAE
jgi:hypothetical protein